MNTKLCIECNQTKLISNFTKRGKSYQPRCKPCKKIIDKAYRDKNEKQLKAARSIYLLRTEEIRQQVAAIYYQENKEVRDAYTKERREIDKYTIDLYYQAIEKSDQQMIADLQDIEFLSELKKLAKRRNYIKERIKADPVFAMTCRLRTMINSSMKRGGYTKRSRTEKILGADYATVFANLCEGFYLIYKRYPDFINDELHIDHIVPISLANTEEEVILLNNYRNLRYMLAADNLEKGAKLLAHYLQDDN